MIALVTGATGFIGSHLVETLLKKGLQVRALIRKTSALQWLKGLPVEFVFGDLGPGGFDSKALKGVDYVFHLAGIIDAPTRKDYFEINVEGTRRLLEALARAQPDLKKFILASSQAAGGPSLISPASEIRGGGVREDDPPHPVSVYGESKLAAEKVALSFASQFPVVILRPPTIYGPRERRVYAAFQMIKRGFALAPGFKPKFISFCYVTNLIEAILLAALQNSPSGRIYNVAGEKAYEWMEFMDAIGKALKRPYRLFRIPLPLLYLLGAGGEVYSRFTRRQSLFTWQKVKEFAQNSWVMDGTRIREELGWREKTTLPQGMAETAAWYQKEGWP